jgi:hypothetical protein
MMSVVTVFLTVAFITFLDCMSQLSSVPAMQLAMQWSGDFDLVMMPSKNRQEIVTDNMNFYHDKMEGFNHPYMNRLEKEKVKTQNHLKKIVPFLNYTEIQEHVTNVYD